LATLRRQSGLTYRHLSKAAGLNIARAYRAINGSGRVRQRDVRVLRQAMVDVLRRKRSSDPELLCHVQERAVAFLRERLSARAS